MLGVVVKLPGWVQQMMAHETLQMIHDKYYSDIKIIRGKTEAHKPAEGVQALPAFGGPHTLFKVIKPY